MQKDKKHRHVTLTFRFISLTQLFDESDTRPLLEREISEHAEEILSGYVDEYYLKEPMDLVIELPEKEIPPDAYLIIPATIKRHFTLLLPELDHKKKLVKRSGIESGMIALLNAVLATIFVYLFSVNLVTETWYTVMIGFILVIANWASFWATYEIFFYDYRDVIKKVRNYKKIIKSPLIIVGYQK